MWITKKRYNNLIALISTQKNVIKEHEILIADLKRLNNSLKIQNQGLTNALYGEHIHYPNSEV